VPRLRPNSHHARGARRGDPEPIPHVAAALVALGAGNRDALVGRLVKRSDGWVRAETAKTRGLNRCFNRTLRYVFKGAATTVITKLPGSPLQQRYAKLLDAGTKPNLAKLTLARAIAATFLSIWKHEENYDPARH
jgi:hypothetical protein